MGETITMEEWSGQKWENENDDADDDGNEEIKNTIPTLKAI